MNKLIVFLIIASIAALAFPHFFQGGGSGDSGPEDPQTPTQYSEVEEYVRKTERDLKEILERIQGAGEVSVRIYVENDGEKALAKDSRTTSRNSSSDGAARRRRPNRRPRRASSCPGRDLRRSRSFCLKRLRLRPVYWSCRGGGGREREIRNIRSRARAVRHSFKQDKDNALSSPRGYETWKK